MRKLLSMLLVVALCLSTVACSSDKYSEDKEAIMASMNELKDNSTKLGNKILEIGSVTGATDLFPYLNKILNSTDMQGILDEIENVSDKKWQEYTDAIFGTSIREAQHQNMQALTAQYNIAIEKFTEFSNEYSELYTSISSGCDTLAEEIKVFKDNNKEEHTEGVELIVDYYLLVSEYAEYVLSPTGTLNEFSGALVSYPEELEQIQKEIDLD